MPATDLFGAFFDTAYAFRFGAPSHDVTLARLIDESGRLIAEAFHFPRGRVAALFPSALSANLRQDPDGWVLDLSADRFTQSVAIAVEGFLPSDNWFHLAPGGNRTIRLSPRDGTDVVAKPSGDVRGLGVEAVVAF